MYKKSMYQWYDQSVRNAVESLADKYDNAIPIFGGALSAYESLPDMQQFCTHLIKVADNAKFFGWHAGTVNALRTFCHLCYIDPMLVESYLGTTFEQLAEE